jgi:transcriptional regulator of acetoin/glycerol metabolism
MHGLISGHLGDNVDLGSWLYSQKRTVPFLRVVFLEPQHFIDLSAASENRVSDTQGRVTHTLAVVRFKLEGLWSRERSEGFRTLLLDNGHELVFRILLEFWGHPVVRQILSLPQLIIHSARM